MWTDLNSLFTQHRVLKNEGKSNENLQRLWEIQTIVCAAVGTNCSAFYYHTAVSDLFCLLLIWFISVYAFPLVLSPILSSVVFPHSLYAYLLIILSFQFIADFLRTFSSTRPTNSCPITSIECVFTLYWVPEARRLRQIIQFRYWEICI